MHKLYKIKEMLMEELEKYGDEKELSAGALTVIDTLSHSIKNLCKIIDDMDESEYSEGMYGRSSYRGRKRDSMGRYSSAEYSRAADDVISQLHDMMDSAPDERSRKRIQNLISEMKNV